MLRLADEAGKVTARAMRIFARTVFEAADAGVDGIIIACSVYCTFVEEIRPFLSVPIVAVDAPALEIAADRGGMIGILATTAGSAPACRTKLDKIARKKNLKLSYRNGIVTEAMDALKNGNLEEHDRLLIKESQKLKEQGCNTLILSQITMARVKDAMDDELKQITLTTPEEGIKELLRNIRKNRRI